MPMLEASHRLDSEGDVMRLSTYQFFHPVNIALQEVAPPGTKVICSFEKPGDRSSRFDVQWALYSTNNVLLKILAVLEVKNTHIIHKSEFTPGEATEETVDTRIGQAMSTGPQLTFLRGNAIWLSKQAAKYTETCPYVAVFDYNAIFAFNYALQNSNRGGAVRGTYFDESSRTSKMTFRLFLFAFVVRPLVRYKLSLQQQQG
ncbi:hypothetical protein BO78DRAFT_395048 [Aspergillus sclerotiicarbonarius CBS 121057]|uniref:Uncharacterized protein n=1 Tax=Aspergillus sclerotiicarbonarius (strain CBS 121057 / IBT 28362) TaxID=1448318 RepID=A0A319EX08_ASPSB|nr:hypothetical protein BO78DRAFT_395048 [Aspergillus sclerotiicarbonarius CBS 121057]